MVKKLINFNGARDKCNGRSRSAIYEDIKYGRLPKPFKNLYEFYKSVLPSLIALAYNPDNYYKVNLKTK